MRLTRERTVLLAVLALLMIVLTLAALGCEHSSGKPVGPGADNPGATLLRSSVQYNAECESQLVAVGPLMAAECYMKSLDSLSSAAHRSEWLKRAGSLFEEANLPNSALSVYQIGGEYAFDEGLYGPALYMFERGVELQEEVFGDRELAGNLYRKAALAAEKNGDIDFSLRLLSGSGEQFLHSGNCREAVASYKRAADLAQQIGRLDFVRSLTQKAADIMAKPDCK